MTRRRRAVWLRMNEDRGDVPGWVLISAMTAGLVIALWAFAGSALTDVFQHALDAVMTGP